MPAMLKIPVHGRNTTSLHRSLCNVPVVHLKVYVRTYTHPLGGIKGEMHRRRLTDDEIDRFYLWLHTVPEYRELIRQRISDEQKRRRAVDARFAQHAKRSSDPKGRRARWNAKKREQRKDVDHLGREVEGCG